MHSATLQMHSSTLRTALFAGSALLAVGSSVVAQTHGEKEEFTAVAIANNTLQTGAGTVLISIDRWSTSSERDMLVVIATDRPIGFWEAYNQPRTVDYPFTIIEMQIGADGRGKGTLSEFTKVLAHENSIYLENFANAPVMLTEIRAEKDND
jgi:hypothetical protein